MQPPATREDSAPSSSPKAPARRPSLLYAALAVIALVEAWTLYATDPDFFFPDMFAGLVIAFALAVVLASRLRDGALRTTLLALAFGVPAVTLLFEAKESYHPDPGKGRMEFVTDRLLRYHYKAGVVLQKDPTDQPMVVGDDRLDDTPHAVEKPADTYRVVVLGDSVPNDPSVPTADRIPRRLEAALAKLAPAGKRVEVVNLSVEGYNTLQEVRLFERVGRKYRPDVVLVAYVLNDAWIQNPTQGRVSNSFFLYRLGAISNWLRFERFSNCTVSAHFDQPYTFDLLVRNSLERLKIYADIDGFQVLVATLPVVERFDDPVCGAMYDEALGAARSLGFGATRVVDSFVGHEPAEFHRHGWMRSDGTHPNAAGHALIAEHVAKVLAPMLAARPILPASPAVAPHLEMLPIEPRP